MAAVAETFEIKRAERKQARLRLALAGSSGGGKTASSLLLARGIVEEYLARGLLTGTLEGKVGLIDTERRSAQLYAHLCPFDVIELDPPYTVDRYIAAMDAMERSGVLVMIVDSISHAWAGDGGVLSILNSIDDRQRFRAFGTQVNPTQDRFVDRILRSSCHMIVTMRSKTAWVVEQVEKNGRTVNQPRRIGLAPVQRPGIEFEFTTLLDLDSQTHKARAVKNRCPVFEDGKELLLTVEVGRGLARWMQEGAPAPAEPLGGTPLDRATAVADAAARACERAANIPDLSRAFADGDKAIREFVTVSVEERAALRARLAEVKDARKAALAAVPTGAGDNLPPDVADALEMLVREAQVDMGGLLDVMKAPVLRAIPEGQLQAAVRWIYDNRIGKAALHMPAALMSRGITLEAGRFDDMKDDLPWQD